MKNAVSTTDIRIDAAKNAINSIQVLGHLGTDEIEELLKQLRADRRREEREAAKKNAASTSIVDRKTTKKENQQYERKVDKRGYHPRNGRWDMLNKMFAELGFEKSTTELFEEANKRSKKLGLEPLKKTAFYSMLSHAKRNSQ